MSGSARRALQHGLQIALRSAQMVGATVFAAYVFAREGVRAPEAGRRGREHLLRALGRALVGLATKLGATFIKAGQIASTRGDLLAEPLRRELATLQDRVPTYPFCEVRRTIESELGQPLETIYEHFEPFPVAAASVAQVHRAVLRGSDQWVAVKVRRPDILEKVRLDRSILLFLGRALERLVPSLRLISLEDAVRSFCDAVEQQIHLSSEAAHNGVSQRTSPTRRRSASHSFSLRRAPTRYSRWNSSRESTNRIWKRRGSRCTASWRPACARCVG